MSGDLNGVGVAFPYQAPQPVTTELRPDQGLERAPDKVWRLSPPLGAHEFVEPQVAAELLKCSEDRIMLGLQRGEIPGVKYGKGFVIMRQAFFDQLNKQAIIQAEERSVFYAASQG